MALLVMNGMNWSGLGMQVIELTQAEYDKLPDTKNNDDVLYHIIDSDPVPTNITADKIKCNVEGLEAINVQDALLEINNNGGSGGAAIDIDFSNAPEDIQDVNTLLQKLLDDFYIAEPVALIPALTANDSNIIYSSQYNTSYLAHYAFDTSTTSAWASANGDSAYLGYYFGTAKRITHVILISESANRGVSQAILQGSNDGLNYYDISNSVSYGVGVTITLTSNSSKRWNYVRVLFSGSSTNNTTSMQFYGN